MEIIDNIYDLFKLENDFNSLVLTDTEPKKGQEFILWRGANDGTLDLKTSLQVYLCEKHGKTDRWKESIKNYKKDLINEILSKIEPSEDLKKQYPWFKPEEHPNDTVWYLSVMQHYGCPTRFADFTSCFWTALFFATDEVKDGKDILLYSLKCKNADEKDEGGNKLPKDCEGNAWKDKEGKVDINTFLGQVIGYKGFEGKKDLTKWALPKQSYGWDKPKMENARIKKQKGFFVYPIDVSKTLEEILIGRDEFSKYKIKSLLIPEIQQILKEKGLTSLSVYLDLDREFNKLVNSIAL